MMRFITDGEPLVAAVMAVSLAASLVVAGTRPSIPVNPELSAARDWAPAAEVARPITGPLHLCRLPIPNWNQPLLVAWQRGQELLVAPVQCHGELPAALHAPARQPSLWRVPLQPWLGFVPNGQGHTLRLPGIALDCINTAED